MAKHKNNINKAKEAIISLPIILSSRDGHANISEDRISTGGINWMKTSL